MLNDQTSTKSHIDLAGLGKGARDSSMGRVILRAILFQRLH